MNTNDRWSQLSMQQRADLIKLYVSNGITSLNDIKKNYNSFGDGGDKNTTSSQQNANPFIVPSSMPSPYWQKTLEDAKKIVEYKYRKYSKDELREHINNVRAGIETEFTYPDGTVVFRKKDSPTEPEYPINLTGIGDAVEAYNVIQNAGNGNLKAAALSASLLLLPDFLGKTFKKGKKAASKTTRRAAPEVDVQNAGYINSIDDVTLDPYARTEIPEEAFMPKANPVNEVKKKVALTEAELQAEFKSLYNNQKVKAILDRPDVSEYVLNYRGATNVEPKLDFNKLRETLLKEGVKPELLTDANLSKLMAARYADYTANITNNMALRNNILIDHPVQPHVYEYTQFRPEGNVGYAYIYDNTPLGNKVGMVENTTSGVSRAKGVSEQAYNSVIGDLGNMTSGELLLDADATMKVLSKYPDKTVLSSGTGTHWYKTGHEYGDIFMLNSPTYEVPVKYIDEFGLEGVSPEGSFIVDFTKGPTYKNGGKLNLFQDGGSKDSRATLIGTVPFNPFRSFNRHYRGTNIYEAESFNDAFRQARIDEQERFVYNGEVYSTELAPNPFVEAAKNWDTEGDLAKEDFRMSIIRNPQGVLEYYNSTYPKGKYTTANKRINSYDIPYMYSLGTKGMEDLVMNKYANHSIGDAIWEELGNSNLSYEQKLAILANSYHETAGWTALQQYGKGPASGIYMMEDDERNNYNNWLNENSLTDSYANQTKYVVSLFDTKSPSLKTAWDRAGDKQEEIRGYKDANEANKKGYRSAYNHLDYTTKQAFKDWKSNDLDAATKAFEGLFERAGVPALENRMRIAHILSKKYK